MTVTSNFWRRQTKLNIMKLKTGFSDFYAIQSVNRLGLLYSDPDPHTATTPLANQDKWPLKHACIINIMPNNCLGFKYFRTHLYKSVAVTGIFCCSEALQICWWHKQIDQFLRASSSSARWWLWSAGTESCPSWRCPLRRRRPPDSCRSASRSVTAPTCCPTDWSATTDNEAWLEWTALDENAKLTLGRLSMWGLILVACTDCNDATAPWWAASASVPSPLCRSGSFFRQTRPATPYNIHSITMWTALHTGFMSVQRLSLSQDRKAEKKQSWR